VKKAAEILGRVLDERSRKIGKAYSSIFGTWSEIVGQSLSEHSHIYEIVNGSLFVEVDHPGWMQLLFMKKQKILQTVKRRFPDMGVKDLRIKVNLSYANTEANLEQSGESSDGEHTVDGEQSEDIDRLLSSVPHQDLRKRLKRLFLSSLEQESAEAQDSGRG
jgi:predicted nucleic acid-binding Zn ribbon protein